MRRLGRTTILGSLTFRAAHGEKLIKIPADVASRMCVAVNVQWSEECGDREILKSEIWTPVSANIWLGTSQKK